MQCVNSEKVAGGATAGCDVGAQPRAVWAWTLSCCPARRSPASAPESGQARVVDHHRLEVEAAVRDEHERVKTEVAEVRRRAAEHFAG